MKELKNKKLIIGSAIAVIVIIAVIVTYFVITNNPTYKVKTAVNSIFDYTNKLVKEIDSTGFADNVLKGKTEINTKILAKVNLSEGIKSTLPFSVENIEKIINASSISANIKTDISGKYLNANVSYLYDNNAVDAKLYINDTGTYLQIKDYYDKFLELQNTSSFSYFDNISSQITTDEISNLIDILKKSFVDSIQDKNIKTEQSEIQIDEEKVDANKIVFQMDNEYLNKVSKNFLENIKKDEKVKKILFNLSSAEYENISEFEKDIDAALEDLNEEVEDKEKVVIEYTIYLKGVFNDVIRQDIKIVDNSEYVIQYTTYKVEKFDECLAVYVDKQIAMESHIMKMSNDMYDITTSIGPEVSFDLKGKINKTNIDLQYALRASGLDEVKGTIKSNSNIVNNKETNGKFEFKLNAPDTYGTVELIVESSTKVLDNLDKVDVESGTNVGDLTQDETMNILQKFVEKNEKLINAITEVINELN